MHDASPDSPADHTPGLTLFETDPGDPPAPVAGWCPLDDRALLRVAGSDAESFLQGQLTQDMARVRAGAVLRAAHCSPKGRVTALFRCWADADAFLLDLPEALGATAQRRLSMYVLRAKVQVSSVAADWERTGVAGAAFATALAEAGVTLPGAPGTVERNGNLLCLALGASRWMLVAPLGTSADLRARLSRCAAADPLSWTLAALRDGDPEVLPETADAFIPQMLNLDHLDGVSFRKGCYTGQEIVARAHFLGRVKRRMRAFGYHGSAAPSPAAQAGLAGPASGDGSAGGQAQIVYAVQTHADGGEALAVALEPTEGKAADATAPAGPEA
jgi:folate-binding protein YgfZ